MKLALAALTAVLALPLASAHAQIADRATWARYSSGNGQFSVELPCSAEQVAAHSPRLAQERRVDPTAAVGCLNNGTLFGATLSTLRENEQAGRPFFDLLLGAVAGGGGANGPAITQDNYAGRRMLISEQASGGTVAKVHIIELSDRSCLMVISGGSVRNTMTSLVLREQMGRFFESVEIAS